MQGRGRLFYLVFGFALGGLLIWLLLRQISPAAVTEAIRHIRLQAVAAALGCYAVALLLRSARWRVLLGCLGPAPYPKVLLVLVIGYAMNSLLPARIGELVRAEQARRIFRFPGTAALGTIAVERLIDGLSVVALLAAGITVLPARAGYAHQIIYLLGASFILFGTMAVIFIALSGKTALRIPGRFAFVESKIGSFRAGLGALRSSDMLAILVWTLLAWTADCASLWFILYAAGIATSPMQLLLTAAIVSLSMLLPTAPGFVGTLQFAFVMAVTTFGYDSARGFAAATAWQIFVLGFLCMTGITLMILNHVHLALRPEGWNGATDPEGPPKS